MQTSIEHHPGSRQTGSDGVSKSGKINRRSGRKIEGDPETINSLFKTKWDAKPSQQPSSLSLARSVGRLVDLMAVSVVIVITIWRPLKMYRAKDKLSVCRD